MIQFYSAKLHPCWLALNLGESGKHSSLLYVVYADKINRFIVESNEEREEGSDASYAVPVYYRRQGYQYNDVLHSDTQYKDILHSDSSMTARIVTL
jgi:hypothetical protein